MIIKKLTNAIGPLILSILSVAACQSALAKNNISYKLTRAMSDVSSVVYKKDAQPELIQAKLPDAKLLLDIAKNDYEKARVNEFIGEIYFLLKDYVNAKTYYVTAINSDSLSSFEKAKLSYLLGNTHVVLNEYENAIGFYRKAYSDLPFDSSLRPIVGYHLGSLYLISEQYEAAIKTSQALIKDSSTPNPQHYALLGMSYYKNGDVDKSYDNLEEAVYQAEIRNDTVSQTWLDYIAAICTKDKTYSTRVQLAKIVSDCRYDKLAPRHLQALAFENKVYRRLNRYTPYPQNAEKKNVSGYVTVQFNIDKQGRPFDIQILEENADGFFNETIMSSAKEWRYLPKISKGAPVVTHDVQVRVDFTSKQTD